ncbi:MAG: hypothetical protein GYB68_07250 [Chloroflexi bacterium]|nr:hypothetical protein [Chloroflexota bacterium]
MGGYVIDILRPQSEGPPLLIEIQTRNFSALKPKLDALLDDYPIEVVHPIPARRWIIKTSAEGELLDERKSPKKGRVEDLFKELIRIPDRLTHPNLSLTVLLVEEEEVRRDDGQGSWRRKGWSIVDRRLRSVQKLIRFQNPADCLALLPEALPDPFTNQELARLGKLPARTAQKMTYCLRHMGALTIDGKRGRANLLSRSDDIF